MKTNIEKLISGTKDTLINLLEQRAKLNELIELQTDQLTQHQRLLATMSPCECLYSKAMYQPYPRLCVKCHQPENND